MRVRVALPLILLVAGAAASMAVGAAPRDDALKPLSVRLGGEGQAALLRGDASAAIDAFEAALASDPRNVGAFTGLAHSYEKLGLPGKAVRFYREALLINPSDLAALEGQGKALIARGATARAQINLARIKALCKADCPEAKRLQTAIAAAATASAAPAKPATARN
ncbi:tetratricopeptide repeat protein [Sandarakinorhabdus sp.]|uniref:tetratricopeptide repeat protein n=1 Tax=Sandarakinorhabdus sp. TaxID=1916663 RepID=UPI00286E0827|nr:tetratricopeptide repeat protein [Sandarakinorhabdus sp.]